MGKQDKAAVTLGVLVVMTAFGYASYKWGLWGAVNLAIWICLLLLYIEFAIYLFAKRSFVLKVIAILLLPLVVLTLFMPSPLKLRVKELREYERKEG